MTSPSGAMICTPGTAPAQTLPSVSQRMPSAIETASGSPGAASRTCVRPFTSRSPSTSHTFTSRPLPVSAT